MMSMRCTKGTYIHKTVREPNKPNNTDLFSYKIWRRKYGKKAVMWHENKKKKACARVMYTIPLLLQMEAPYIYNYSHQRAPFLLPTWTKAPFQAFFSSECSSSGRSFCSSSLDSWVPASWGVSDGCFCCCRRISFSAWSFSSSFLSSLYSLAQSTQRSWICSFSIPKYLMGTFS